MIITPAYQFICTQLKSLEVKKGRKVGVEDMGQELRLSIGKALLVLEPL